MNDNHQVPWKRISIEAVAIVASILLAFAIDAWWDRQQQYRLENAMLAAVVDEINANYVALEEHIAGNEHTLSLNDQFLRGTSEEFSRLELDEIDRMVASLNTAMTFNRFDSAAAMYAGTPPPDQSGIHLRSQVSNVIRELVDVVEDHHRLQRAQDNVRLRVAYHLVGESRNGLAQVGPTAARLGPSVLNDLRADDELIAAIVDKAHLQRVYIREMQGGLILLESVRETLSSELESRL